MVCSAAGRSVGVLSGVASFVQSLTTFMAPDVVEIQFGRALLPYG